MERFEFHRSPVEEDEEEEEEEEEEYPCTVSLL